MSGLLKCEKETILLTNESDAFFKVFTHNSAFKRRLAAFAKRYPEVCRFIREDPEGSVTYEVDKGRLAIMLVPPFDGIRLENLSRSAKERRLWVRL